MESSFYVQAAEAFFRDHADQSAGSNRDPFALVVSFYEPHAPFKFPDDWPTRFRPDQFLDQPLTELDRLDQPTIFANLTADQRRGIAASHFTSINFLDAQVGRVFDALAASGLAEETIVVYFGDNGYLHGEHGRLEKHCFFEGAVRVPLILRWPGHLPADHRVIEQVELVDVVPTLLDLIGAPELPDLHGESFRALAEGRPGARGREVVVSEYLENREAMARTDRYKLIVAAEGRRRHDGYAPKVPPVGASVLLFDEVADPGETVDLSDRPELASVVDRLRGQLLDRLRTTRDGRVPVPPGLTDAEALRWCLTPQD